MLNLISMAPAHPSSSARSDQYEVDKQDLIVNERAVQISTSTFNILHYAHYNATYIFMLFTGIFYPCNNDGQPLHIGVWHHFTGILSCTAALHTISALELKLNSLESLLPLRKPRRATTAIAYVYTLARLEIKSITEILAERKKAVRDQRLSDSCRVRDRAGSVSHP